MTKNKINTEVLDHITHPCDECMCEGEVSSCCGDVVDDHRCLQCGKFCRVEVCQDCGGEGSITYRVGDEVEVFVCVWSSDDIKEQLYRPKKFGDAKTFRGKITSITDDYNVTVKIPYRGSFNIKVDDITGV